jgi:tRNA(Ile)-lysidine synthase
MLDNKLFLQSNKHLLPNNATYLLAVSGGVDSMVLWHIMQQAGYNIAIVHCNYQLRNADSDADEALVTATANEYGNALYKIKFDTKNEIAIRKKSLQEVARDLRYEFFNSIATNNNINFILTAHHANDNVETILQHIARGTGLDGLMGIPAKNINILRPLLPFTKQAILAYANSNSLQFREDSSNAKNDYSRNILRNEVIPIWENYTPQLVHNMQANIVRWQGVNAIYKKTVEKEIAKICENRNGDIYIAINYLNKLGNVLTWLFEICKKYNFSSAQIIEVEKLLLAHTGSCITSASHKIFKQQHFLVVTKINTAETNIVVINENDNMVILKNSTLQIIKNSMPKFDNSDNDIAYLNADKITWPLILRPWQPGDYFYPLGLGKQKKIARFLIDSKVPQHKKNEVYVLVSNNKIIWTIGHRIDDRFKLKPNAANAIKLVCKAN